MIDLKYNLTPEQIGFFRENGYIHLKSVLSEEVLERHRTEVVAKVRELSTETLPLDRPMGRGRELADLILTQFVLSKP